MLSSPSSGRSLLPPTSSSSSSSSSSANPISPSPSSSEEEEYAGDPPPPSLLIPGLPDDIASVILAAVPFSLHARLRRTSRNWSTFLSRPSLLPLRRRLRLPLRHLLCIFPSDPSLHPPFLFDPSWSSSSSPWISLPPLPCNPYLYGLCNFVPIALGHRLYLLGGSHFDARSYPLGRPLPSRATYLLDLSSEGPLAWRRLPDMISPRGSFACASDPDGRRIIVAGGGSRHTMYPSVGSRMSSVEIYDAEKREWVPGPGLPRYRAGCVGFLVHRRAYEDEEDEFWVMGGYGDYRAISGVIPSDVYYKDAAVLGLRSGKWSEIGDMWGTEERRNLGSIAVLEDGRVESLPSVFMLDRNNIFRYSFRSNRWLKVSSLQRRIPEDQSSVFAAMNGELYVLSSTAAPLPSDSSSVKCKLSKKHSPLQIQVYNPSTRKWRCFSTSPPFHQPLDFKSVISCTIQL